MRTTRRAALAAIPGLVLLASGAGRAQELAPFRVAGPANDGFRAVYYAVRSGIFRRFGLDVQPLVVNSGAAAMAALIGGSAEVAYTNIVSVILAHRRGIPLQVIVPATLYDGGKSSSTALLVRKDSPIKSGRDLDGKVFGTLALGDINAVATMDWIDRTGGDSKTVRTIEVPASAVVAFLEEGRADAVAAVEPGVGQAVASGKVRVVTHPFDAIAPHFESGAYATTDAVTAKNPDVMSRFARAMHESQLYTNTHLAETIEMVASYSGLSPDAIAHSNRMVDPEYVEVRNIQPVIDVLAKYGQLDKAFPAEEIISSAALKPPR
jgi:NitT/TauT family transport system substrate-binding protein